MNKFKLIMENWRQYVKEEEVNEVFGLSSKEKMDKAMAELPAAERVGLETVGDLKKFLKYRKAMAVGGEVGKQAAELAADLLPGGRKVLDTIYKMSDAKDAAGFIKGIFSAKDSYNTGTGLDKLNVDDNVSAIVDDPIEANFIQDFVKNVLAGAPDDTPLEKYDVTRLLQQFIAGEFDDVTVKK